MHFLLEWHTQLCRVSSTKLYRVRLTESVTKSFIQSQFHQATGSSKTVIKHEPLMRQRKWRRFRKSVPFKNLKQTCLIVEGVRVIRGTKLKVPVAAHFQQMPSNGKNKKPVRIWATLRATLTEPLITVRHASTRRCDKRMLLHLQHEWSPLNTFVLLKSLKSTEGAG